MQVTYKTEKTPTKRVYLNESSGTVKPGYAVCYDRANVDATNAAGTTLTASYSSYARHNYVKKPASGNLHNFAGVIGPGKSSYTCPCWVDIIEPRNMGVVVDAYSDYNATAITSFATVQADSYYIGGLGEGFVIGQYLQTRDGATTNGPTQIEMWGADKRDIVYGTALPSSTNNVLSYPVWEACPWNMIQSGRIAGVTFFDDFMQCVVGADGTSAMGYNFDLDTDVTCLQLETSDEVGGVLEIANNDADNDFGHIWLGNSTTGACAIIAATNHKPFWFEARLKKASVATDTPGLFIGLGEVGLQTTDGGALVDNTGEVKDENFIGFQILCADGDGLSPVYKADGQTKQNGTEVDIEADTYFNVGMAGNGTTIASYINGVSKQAITAANIAAATFPSATYLTPMLLTKVGAASECAVQMDWWRFAQLR